MTRQTIKNGNPYKKKKTTKKKKQHRFDGAADPFASQTFSLETQGETSLLYRKKLGVMQEKDRAS